MHTPANQKGKRNGCSYLLKNIWQNKSSYIFMAPFLIIFFTFTILPVGTAIYYSFTQFNILEAPIFTGLQNYRKLLLNDPVFITTVKNTFLLAGITGPVSYFLCLFFAWFVNELGPKSRSILTLIFYSPSMVSITFVWQLIFSGDSNGILNAWLTKLGIINSPIQWLKDTSYILPVVIVVILWSSLGTSFLTFIAGFQTVDTTLYEAGAIDGVKNRWQELWYITLPSMAPQMMFGAVMSISGSFGIGAAITGLVGYPSTNYVVHTIMHHLEDYGSTRFEMGYACAIATILFIVMISMNKIVRNLISKVGK